MPLNLSVSSLCFGCAGGLCSVQAHVTLQCLLATTAVWCRDDKAFSALAKPPNAGLIQMQASIVEVHQLIWQYMLVVQQAIVVINPPSSPAGCCSRRLPGGALACAPAAVFPTLMTALAAAAAPAAAEHHQLQLGC